MFYHDLKATFIHCQKTAGSAIRQTLAAHSPNHSAPGPSLHYSALEHRAADPRAFAAYWSFAIVRNPWARWVSWFNQVTETREKYAGDFRAYVLDHGFPCSPQVEKVTDPDGNVIVDYIGHFTALPDAWRTITERLNLPAKPLPIVNRKAHPHYTTYYTPELVDIVGQLSAADIFHWGFTFGDPDL